MARQARSEATRRKIIDAAIDMFGEFGYSGGGWGKIVKRTGMTKGALYHHFDAKEPLASAIIEEGSGALLVTFRNGCGSGSPALENMIHGTFAVANMLSSDKMARAAVQLAAALNGFNKAASGFYANWVAGRWLSRPGGQSLKETSGTISIRKWSASRSSAPYSESGCSPQRDVRP